jgi:ubiquinone/menaquinone biosynthesis C-methylase UbiE
MSAENSVEQNLAKWNVTHNWEEDGDEWKGQALKCGVPYQAWKASVVANVIDPLLIPGSRILEIGSGHGRWSGYLAARAKELFLVDLSPDCLKHCRARFKHLQHIQYRVTDGSSLPTEIRNSIDFIWSFDCFVHIERPQIELYFREFWRVLAPSGKAVVHHANRRNSTLALGGLRALGRPGKLIYRMISMGLDERDDGWRSNVSAELMSEMAEKAGLLTLRQFNRWGEANAGVPRYNDRITVLQKPSDAESSSKSLRSGN